MVVKLDVKLDVKLPPPGDDPANSRWCWLAYVDQASQPWRFPDPTLVDFLGEDRLCGKR